MEQVPMNDGLDGRETIAFGLGAGEVAAFVLALMTAYAVIRSGLAGVVAWPVAGLVAGGGAALAWGRLAGRPMLEWAVLLAGFMVRTAPARAARTRRRLDAWSAGLRARASEVRLRVLPRVAAVAPGKGGDVVLPLALRRLEPTAAARTEVPVRPPRAGSHVVGFFSLAGGAGRTTLAVELAATLAVRGRTAAATGAPGRRVVLLDLARRNPAVGLRLGLPPPAGAADGLIAHPTGLLVGVAPSSSPGAAAPAFPAALVDDASADVVVVDFDCDLGDHCRDVLARCDQLLVTLTPTAGGVLDAYRSTALLRRLGLRERIGHVVNRWRPGLDLREVMADLGGEIMAEIPDDQAFVDGENQHRVAGLDGGGEVAAALERLATCIEHEAGAPQAVPDAPRWGSHAG
jgi:hypothetical protein